MTSSKRPFSSRIAKWKDEQQRLDAKRSAWASRDWAAWNKLIEDEHKSGEFWTTSAFDRRGCSHQDFLTRQRPLVEAYQKRDLGHVCETSPGKCPSCGDLLVVVYEAFVGGRMRSLPFERFEKTDLLDSHAIVSGGLFGVGGTRRRRR
jgi:hypothetical protein